MDLRLLNNTEENKMEEKTAHEMYLLDVMGTTTPKSEITKVTEYILQTDEVKTKLGKEMGYEDITSLVEQGEELGMKGEKSHPVFREYLKVWDRGAQMGYESGDLTMSLESGVEETLKDMYDEGARIRIFSTGAVETSELGMKSCGLDDLIEAYHSSSEKDIGSKIESDAYTTIARKAETDVSDICYVTDDAKEAKAAVESGFGRVYFIDKKAEESTTKDGYQVIRDFTEIKAEEMMKEYVTESSETAET